MNRLAIIGSNDLGTLIAYHAIHCDWKIAGFFDNRKTAGTHIDDYGKVLGPVDAVEDSYARGQFDRLMIGVGYTQFTFRKEAFERFKGKIPFANLVHPSAYCDPSLSLGEGIFILPGCIVDMGVRIGDNVLLNTGCRVAHHSAVGNHSFVAPGVTIAGNVVIGECCFLGVGSVIQDNVTMAAKTLIGGGSLVIKDITEPGTYVGAPSKRLKDNIFF